MSDAISKRDVQWSRALALGALAVSLVGHAWQARAADARLSLERARWEDEKAHLIREADRRNRLTATERAASEATLAAISAYEQRIEHARLSFLQDREQMAQRLAHTNEGGRPYFEQGVRFLDESLESLDRRAQLLREERVRIEQRLTSR